MGSLSTGTDEGWDDLRGAIEQIYLGKKPLTKSRYMALYTRAMNLCRVKAFRETPRHRVAGYELYKYLKTFLSNHVTTLSNSANGLVMADDILRFYSSEWERFKSCSERLSHILPFRNVNSLKNEWPECTERLYTTYQLSLLTWRDVFLHAYGTKVRDGVLDLIENERRGGPVDISWIRSVVFSYVELGLIEIKEDPSKRQPELEVYKTAFECPFLENTERFYQRVAAKLFEQNPVSEYVKKVEQHLDEEERRVELYLHASTLKPLVRTLWEVLIQKNFKSLRSEFKNFLSEDRRDGLVNMYQLMSRSSDAIFNLAAMFEEHVYAEGMSAVERVGDMAAKDPTLHVDILIQVYRKYNDIVLTAFANDACFVLFLSIACKRFINNNAVTFLDQSTRKSPEFFAAYCDTLLSRSSEAPQLQLDDAVVGFTAMLQCIDDKDVFQKCCTQVLATRLLQRLSVSEGMEEKLMHKFGNACGNGYAWTLQRMFRDVSASKEVNEQFVRHMKNSNECFRLDFSIHVLASGLWPFRLSSHLKLPPELEGIVQSFATFYSGLYSTRKIQPLHNLSKGELVTSCFKEDYTLHASTFQIAVLLQYNQGLSFTVQQLQEGTSMDMRILQQVLESLLKCRLILCHGEKTEEFVKLRPDTIVSLFEGYHNNNLVVDINEPLEEELKAEQHVTQKMIDDERKMLVQSSIVRIMKIRKTLQHQELITEIVRQLERKFGPDTNLIEECITNLIENGYLEKDGLQLNTYHYVA